MLNDATPISVDLPLIPVLKQEYPKYHFTMQVPQLEEHTGGCRGGWAKAERKPRGAFPETIGPDWAVYLLPWRCGLDTHRGYCSLGVPSAHSGEGDPVAHNPIHHGLFLFPKHHASKPRVQGKSPIPVRGQCASFGIAVNRA